MAPSVVAGGDAVQRFSHLAANSSDTIATLADFIRAEVHARKHSPRAAMLWRVVRLLAPALPVDEARLDDVCGALECDGDVVLAPGGILYATPTRVVALGRSARVFSSVPTPPLAASLGCQIISVGVTRTVAARDDLDDVVAQIGGIVVTPEAWAALDCTDAADATFLARLDARLEWEPQRAGALENDGPLEWRAWQITADGGRWRRSSEGRLWWARTRIGSHHRVWTANGSPATSPFILLSHDDAARARFALSRDVANAPVLRIERSGDRVIIEVPGWLPRPEYRWLSLRATLALEGNRTRWAIAAKDEATITHLLAERLGVRSAASGSVGGPSPEPRSATAPPGNGDTAIALAGSAHDAERERVDETSTNPTASAEVVREDESIASADPVDETVPHRPAIGPLLRALRVRTYRDLLAVQLDRVREMRAIGTQKVKALERLIAEARRRANADTTIQSSVDPASTAVTTPRFNYDAWNPTSVLRPLPKRIANILAVNNIETIAALKSWHRDTDRDRVDNYGRKTHRVLGDLLTRLEEEGHESLVFGGAAPATVAHFAQLFFEQVRPATGDILELRFVHGWTLEQIGQQKKVTRERIRQVIERELADVTPSWGPRVRELLDPAVRALEARGRIALTSVVLQSLGLPSLWALELACHVGGIELSVDTIPRITTMLPPEEFERLRRDLRRHLDAIRGPLLARAVRDAMAEVGLWCPESELPTVSDAMFGITIDGDAAFPNRRSVQYLYLKVLREAGGPISAEEVAQRVNDLDPSIAATKRNAVAHFQRDEHVFSYSHGKWVHEDHLPLSRKELDDLAARCLPEIAAAGGKAVNARLLLERLTDRGSAVVPPHVLRDAIIATGKVRGWRSGTDVAWLGGDVSRTTIAEWIAEVASELEQPFDIMELVESVSERSGHSPGSVFAQVGDAREVLVPLGGAQYISRRVVWPSDSEYGSALRRVENAVLQTALLSAEDPALRIPGLEAAVAKFGTGVIWGLASRLSRSIGTRQQGLFAWPTSQGETLWSVVAKHFVDHHQVFMPKALRDYLFRVGLRTEWVVHNFTAEWVAEGHLGRIGMGWYIDCRVSFERQVDLIDAQPEVREIALGSQDFVRESPFREALNEVRCRHGSFRVPLE